MAERAKQEARALAAAAGPVKVIQLANGDWAVATLDANGNVQMTNGKPNILQGQDSNGFFTEKSKNEGNVDHASSKVGTNQTAATLNGDTADGPTGLLAWEDLAATKKSNGQLEQARRRRLQRRRLQDLHRQPAAGQPGAERQQRHRERQRGRRRDQHQCARQRHRSGRRRHPARLRRQHRGCARHRHHRARRHRHPLYARRLVPVARGRPDRDRDLHLHRHG